jgi:hypothetical protein
MGHSAAVERRRPACTEALRAEVVRKSLALKESALVGDQLRALAAHGLAESMRGDEGRESVLAILEKTKLALERKTPSTLAEP